jgi:hypothetical protein
MAMVVRKAGFKQVQWREKEQGGQSGKEAAHITLSPERRCSTAVQMQGAPSRVWMGTEESHCKQRNLRVTKCCTS